MYKLNLKKLKYLLPFLMLFINTTPIYADSNYTDEPYAKSLYDSCNSSTGCIPICIYGDETGKERAYIGYHYDQTSVFKWEIGTSLDDITIIGDPDESTHLYVFSDIILPTTDIHWENYDDEKYEPWNKAPAIDENKNAYTKVTEDFYCPPIVSIDHDFKREICFSRISGKCEERSNFQENTSTISKLYTIDEQYSINYYFAVRLKQVIDNAYSELSIPDSTTAAMVLNPSKYPGNAETVLTLQKEKVKFLNQVDPQNIKYDESKSGEENAKSNCETLKEKFKDEKNRKSYINGLVDKSNNWNSDVLNNQLILSAQNSDAANANIYTYDSLSNIFIIKKDSNGNLVKRNIKDASGTNYYDKLNSIFIDNVNTSVKYMAETCNLAADSEINYDEETFKEELQEEYETHIYEAIQIDLESTLSCSSLSGIADLISKAYFIIEIAALVILVIFTALDYAKVILSDGQDEMKKVNKKLLTRLIITVVILLLPALINFVLGIFNIQGFNSEDPLCVEIKNK